jgi:hypothetical protein
MLQSLSDVHFHHSHFDLQVDGDCDIGEPAFNYDYVKSDICSMRCEILFTTMPW